MIEAAQVGLRSQSEGPRHSRAARRAACWARAIVVAAFEPWPIRIGLGLALKIE
jgi:hypothetical protein